jgi:hypothetical protein
MEKLQVYLLKSLRMRSCARNMSIPMGEFWNRALHPELMYYQDVRGAASASHVYGKNLVAAEAYTGGGFESPRTLKKIGDYWFAQGINRFVFHTSAHQPLDSKPGNTMVGTHINRNITWAEEAEPFMKYLARNSFMLQQGRFVADIVYLLDEGAPSTMPIWGSGLTPAPPEGYDYDYINADALITRMTVSGDGKLILPDGMRYSLLVLPNTDKMTLPVLQKIHGLVKAGASIAGRRPLNSPGLSGYPDSDERIKDLATEIWGDLDGISRTMRSFGKGKVFWNTPVGKILTINGIIPDLEYVKPPDAKLNWLHRSTDDSEIYFLVNSSDRALSTEVRFRVTGMEAEMWDPASGKTGPLSFSITKRMTVVPLSLSANESAFIVFRNKTEKTERMVRVKDPLLITEIRGPWEISFAPGMGAPSVISIDTLTSWTVSKDEAIKYYSGSAVYATTIEAPKKWIEPGLKLILDLGEVGDIAEVNVNGINTGILWKYPYQVDISGLLRKGQNKLQIRVINQWTNRLAGDQLADPGKKVLNTSLRVFGGRGLNDSGLLGPVKIFNY